MDIDINKFTEQAKEIHNICSKHSYMDRNFCEDENGHRCPFSKTGGCEFNNNWSVLPCEFFGGEI